MEYCGALRGDTDISEPVHRYVYPLFFLLLRKEVSSYHLKEIVTQLGLRQESNNMQRWNIVALAGGGGNTHIPEQQQQQQQRALFA